MNRLIYFVSIFMSLLVSATSVQAQQFSQFFFFGDSLTDVGNSIYAPHTNDHGLLWSNHIVDRYGSSISPSNNGGNDYAVYGATASQILNNQINTYLNSGKGIDPNALYSVWGGNNDLLNSVHDALQAAITAYGEGDTTQEIIDIATNTLESGLNTAATQATSDIVTGVGRLHNAGAKYLMVANAPNVGHVPLEGQIVEALLDFGVLSSAQAAELGAAMRFAMTEGALAFNSALAAKLNALPYDVVQVDIYSLMNVILADPARFGLQNVTDTYCTSSFLNDGCTSVLPNVNPNTYLFYDSVHPTTYGQEMIADAIYSYFTGPVYSTMLTRAALNAMEGQFANINSQLLPFAGGNAPMDRQLDVFVSGTYSPQQPQALGATMAPGYQSKNQNATIGVQYYYSPTLILGAAVGPTFGRNQSNEEYQFDISEYVVSVFGQYSANSFYVSAIGSYGLPTYSGIQRTIPIGIAMSTSDSASTQGQHFAANSNVGYNLVQNERFLTGPVAGLTYQYMGLDGYAESGLINGLNLDYFNQNQQSLVSSIGWQGTLFHQLESMRLFFTANTKFNTEHLGGVKDIRFGTVSIPGSHGAVPAAFPKGSYGSAGAGIGAEFKNKLRLIFNAQSAFGNEDFSQQFFTLTASLPL